MLDNIVIVIIAIMVSCIAMSLIAGFLGIIVMIFEPIITLQGGIVNRKGGVGTVLYSIYGLIGMLIVLLSINTIYAIGVLYSLGLLAPNSDSVIIENKSWLLWIAAFFLSVAPMIYVNWDSIDHFRNETGFFKILMAASILSIAMFFIIVFHNDLFYPLFRCMKFIPTEW